MGEEWGETRPFCFFTDFHGELGNAVREGRRNEFRKWSTFQHQASRARIPDPNAPATFGAAKLDWSCAEDPDRRARLALTSQLLDLRRSEIVPRLKGVGGHAGRLAFGSSTGFGVEWKLADGSRLILLANLSAARRPLPDTVMSLVPASCWRLLYESSADASDELKARVLPAWSVVFMLADAPAAKD
jgi:1,4-alpha-glucan branching enzyme